METFDYSQVPYGFGLCASADCPKASTCLRHIAFGACSRKISVPAHPDSSKTASHEGKMRILSSEQDSALC